MKKVLIPTKLDAVAHEILTSHGGYEVIQDDSLPMAEAAATTPDAHALIVRSEKVTADIIDALPKLKVIVRAGAGFNTIDTRYARAKGIDVMNTPGANSNAVAEEVVAMMLADARHIVPADISTRQGLWEKKRFMGKELTGKTVGIVGLGNIGQLVAKRLSGFEVKLVGFDPMISADRAKAVGVTLVDTPEEVFRVSDYITLHIPENDETRGFVGEKLLSIMPDGATIVNCARAGIIDEDALRATKGQKGIRYLNDVYPKDEAGEKSIKDVADLMLPHLGASTREANYNAARRAAEELIDLEDKGVTSFIVNRDIPEGLDETYCELANTLARLCRCIVGRQATPCDLKTSFYGVLNPYAEWLLTPVLAGISDEFDKTLDFRAAQDFLGEMGITYVNREIDPDKPFDNSITIDLSAALGDGTTRTVSVRGTLAESLQMVARIDEFDRLYFEPKGPTMFFLYDDRPGVIGKIGAKLAEAGINIEDMRNPHDPNTNRSLAILKTNTPGTCDIMDQIGSEIDAVASFCINF
jgi:D-3-phosphoglycerate dehydrogenase